MVARCGDKAMPDEPKDQAKGGAEEAARPQADRDPGYAPGAPPEFGAGFGRDFGGYLRGTAGGYGRGYGASLAPGDYRETVGGFFSEAYAVSFGGRGDDTLADDRSWIDVCAEDECSGRPHHRGQGPKGWARSDQQIYEAVCERLTHDRLIDARGMAVEVEEGVVTLRGLARAAADPRHAAELARDVAGVRDVRLELTVAAPDLRHPSAWEQLFADDKVDRNSFSPPIIAGRAPPPTDISGAS
jgi:hypothetical protein